MCFLGVWSNEDKGNLCKTSPSWTHTCGYLKEQHFSEALKCVNQAAARSSALTLARVFKNVRHEAFAPILCKYLGVSVCVQISLCAQWQRDSCNLQTFRERVALPFLVVPYVFFFFGGGGLNPTEISRVTLKKRKKHLIFVSLLTRLT